MINVRLVLAALTIVFCLFSGTATAQSSRYSVSGVVHDSTDTALPNATVVVLTRADSVLTTFGTSNREGRFLVRRVEAGEYILQITYVGFQTLYHSFEITDSDVDVGRMEMHEQTELLEEFVVSAERIPMSVGRDTVVYNVKAFGYRPNDVVEDVLRRLPGIEVDRDGSIRAHGEDVQNVLVDGKIFFGGDHKIATRNLPAEAIEKVEVYDKESDRAELTGVPDGQEERTINLALEEDAKNGYFGNFTSGLGGENIEQGRYDLVGNLYRFSPNTQMSFLTNANNVNKQQYGIGNSFSILGSGFGSELVSGIFLSSGGKTGFSQNLSGGVNYLREIGSRDKSEVQTSYYISHLDASEDRTTLLQQVLGSDISSRNESTSASSNTNLTHTVELNSKLKFGLGHDMRFRGKLSAVSSTFDQTQSQVIFSEGRQLLQTGVHTVNNTDDDALNTQAALIWRKRLSDGGPSLVLESTFNSRGSDSFGTLDSETVLESLGEPLLTEALLQRQEEDASNLSHNQELALTIPMKLGWNLEAFTGYRYNTRDRDKSFYDRIDGDFLRNLELSQRFKQSYDYFTTGFTLSVQPSKETYLSGRFAAQRASLNGRIEGAADEITNDYFHLLSNFMMNHSLKEGSRIQVRYSGSVRTPTVIELQPFANNTNPLRVYVGNPNLRPQYTHSLRSSFRFYDQFTFVGFSLGGSVSITQSDIVTTRVVDELLRQTTSRVNADTPSLSTGGSIGFESPIRPLGINIRLSNRLTFTRGTAFINGAENTNRSLNNIASLTVRNRFTDVLELQASYSASYNQNRYSLNEEANQNYLNGTLRGDVTWNSTENLSFESSLVYRIFDQNAFGERAPGSFPSAFGEQQNLAIVNASVSYLLLRNRGEIRLDIYDVFDQNKGINYTNAATYVQEERVLSLGRYMMLKLIYRPKGKTGSGFLGF